MIQDIFNSEIIESNNFMENMERIPLKIQAEVIQYAIKFIEKQLKTDSLVLSSKNVVTQYLCLQLAKEPNEIFGVLFLDNRLRLLAFEKLFQGTINAAIVYPRVIIQRVLAHNAASVILVHNHPSGSLLPSYADKQLTEKLKLILELLDVRLLDHYIVSLEGSFSFASESLL